MCVFPVCNRRSEKARSRCRNTKKSIQKYRRLCGRDTGRGQEVEVGIVGQRGRVGIDGGAGTERGLVAL